MVTNATLGVMDDPWYWNKINLFDGTSPAVRLAFLEQAERREYRRGSHIFRAPDAGSRVFFLERGVVKIYHLTSKGEVTIFWFCVRGDLFGAGGISGSMEQSVYAQAVEQSVVYVLSRPAFEELLRECPQLGLNVIRLMGARLRLACDAVTDKMTQKTDARLARILLRLAKHWGEPSGSEVRLRVRITHQEIANMMGACRQTVNRALHEFVDEGLVRFDGRTLIVTRPAALADRVEGEPPMAASKKEVRAQ